MTMCRGCVCVCVCVVCVYACVLLAIGADNMTLSFFLDLPQDIIKRTPEDHPDYKNLGQAQETMVYIYRYTLAKLHMYAHVHCRLHVHVHTCTMYMYVKLLVH